MKLQVDGDVVTFRAGFGAEHMEYDVVYHDSEFGENVSISCRYKKDANAVLESVADRGIAGHIESRRVLEPLRNALHNVGTILANVLEQTGAVKKDMTVWISGDSELNYRKEIATIKPYKGNRKEAWRPTYEQEIKDYIKRQWNGLVTVGQEADDAMGIAQMALPTGESCIVTNDKDLNMIPGLHYNFVTDERYNVSADVAYQLFWHQMCEGDSTDNILGCPGIGPSKTLKHLDGVAIGDIPAAVFALYVQSYGLAAYPAFLENGRLLWIRRQEGELWAHRLA